jgi:hypothetical protein
VEPSPLAVVRVPCFLALLGSPARTKQVRTEENLVRPGLTKYGLIFAVAWPSKRARVVRADLTGIVPLQAFLLGSPARTMAKRYSGNLQIRVTYDDRGHYRTAVSSGGEPLWHGTVRPAPAGFGPGVAYDSPQAYDEVASSALAFADNEKGGIGDEAEFKEDLTGYLIRRSPRSGKKASVHAAKRSTLRTPQQPHRSLGASAPKKSSAQIKREVDEVLARGSSSQPSLYQELIAAGIPTDSHESDLYVLNTPVARGLIAKHGKRGVVGFNSKVDGKRWLDVPFAYDPFWERKRR